MNLPGDSGESDSEVEPDVGTREREETCVETVKAGSTVGLWPVATSELAFFLANCRAESDPVSLGVVLTLG